MPDDPADLLRGHGTGAYTLTGADARSIIDLLQTEYRIVPIGTKILIDVPEDEIEAW